MFLDKVKPSLSRSTGDISNFVPPHVVSPSLLQDSVMNACHRGCRLYSICQFVNGNAGFNTSKEECQGGEDTREENLSRLYHQGPINWAGLGYCGRVGLPAMWRYRVRH